jgi:hypothetical protein
MAAGQYDLLKIEQGATFLFEVGWKDSTGELIDLTGYEARMQVRKTHKSATAILDLTSTGGDITLSDGAAFPNIVVEASATDTADIVASDLGAAVYDLELEDGDGRVTRVVEGKCLITPEVTR